MPHKRYVALALFLLLPILLAPQALAGSWSQINQPLAQQEDWRQIVADSAFALGEVASVSAPGGKTFAERAYGTYPSIDGSTVMVPMAVEFARQHLGLGEADLAGFVAFSTTHNAYLNLMQRLPNGSAALAGQEAVMDASHPVDLMLGTEPSDTELAMAEALGVTLVKRPVCLDAFVFITHASNPVENLSLDQIRAIYRQEITNWQEVGGQDAPIDAYQRNQNSGSQTAMENLVMQGEPIVSLRPQGVYYVNEMSNLVSLVGGYQATEHGIGYTYKYYIDALYRDDGIKILSIDGVYPSEETLRAGTYPLTVPYYGVIRQGDEAAPGGLFLDWMLTEEGQRCIAQAGYIPLMPLADEGAGE